MSAKLIPLSVLLLMMGCASSLRYTQSIAARGISGLQQQLLDAAAALVGTPYCTGGAGKQCVDCSGYVQVVFATVGVYLPRTTLQQSLAGSAVRVSELQAGDLVFFRLAGKQRVSHVGIYAGDGTIFHASQSRGVVRERLWGTYLERAISHCRRVLNTLEDVLP